MKLTGKAIKDRGKELAGDRGIVKARLMKGQIFADLAKEFGLNPGTVRAWRSKLVKKGLLPRTRVLKPIVGKRIRKSKEDAQLFYQGFIQELQKTQRELQASQWEVGKLNEELNRIRQQLKKLPT